MRYVVGVRHERGAAQLARRRVEHRPARRARTPNVRRIASTSLAAGWNAYAWFTDAVVAGVPKIVGGVFGAGPTVSVNGASEVVALPSVTLIVTVDEVFGVRHGRRAAQPARRRVERRPAGGPWMLNVSASPSTSFAVGWNAYAWFTDAVVAGVPKIVGGVFGAGPTVRRERCERGRCLAIGHADRDRG